jgi:hypothetical protein
MATVDKRLFCYKQTHDTGFAPNPFHGHCTLATCKPGMRRSKRVGDWVAGFTSEQVTKGRDQVGKERLIYLMQISEVLPMEWYFTDPRFEVKKASRPDDTNAPCISTIGDNIYELVNNVWIQHPNWSHDKDERETDLSGKNALIAEDFYYFGIDPLVIPDEIRPRIPVFQACHGWRTRDQAIVQAFLDYVRSRGCGIHARPHSWKTGDESWRHA